MGASLKSDFFIFITTLLLVMHFTINVGIEDYVKTLRTFTSESVEVVTSSINAATATNIPVLGTTAICLAHPPPVQNSSGIPYNIWERIDCIMAYIMGADPAEYPNMAVDPYLPGAFPNSISKQYLIIMTITFGLLFSFIGPFLLLAALAIPIFMISAFAQGLFIYLQSIIVVTFLGLIGPIIIPLALFKTTKSIFEAWLQTLFAYTLQPMIIMGYLAFMVHAISYVIGGTEGMQIKVIKGLDNAGNVQNVQDSTGADITTFNTAEARGLAAIYSMARHEPEKKIGSTVVLTIVEPTTNVTSSSGSGTDLSSNKGLGKSGLHLPKYKFFDDEAAHVSAVMQILQTFIVLALLLLVTLSFMTDVMNLGLKLAGISAPPLGTALNIFNKSTASIAKAMSR